MVITERILGPPLFDLKVFKEMLSGNTALLALLVIGVGAPLSEELLFRGFLFSGLAKSRLGLIGTSILTAVLWTALHFGYSVFGLIEVLAIGLYFSWLLVKTGSLWVTIFCHAVYNTVVGLVLYSIVNNLLSIGQQWYITRAAEDETKVAAAKR